MSKESFSSESNNPRIRRSFAHARINTAIATGKAEDKLAAVEAAAAASKTRKGEDLGRQAVSAVLNSTPNVIGIAPKTIEDAHLGGYSGWTSSEFVRRHDAVQDAMGIDTGTVHTKPETS